MPTPPILEFDSEKTAMIDPTTLIKKLPAMPAHCVLCFFNDVIAHLHAAGELEQIATLRSEMGVNPVYTLTIDGRRVALVNPGVGAPLAAATLEEAIGLGGRYFVACGGAGTLDHRHHVGALMVPTLAIRDEGTSYHYLPADQPAAPSARATTAITGELTARGIGVELVTTWTTDAFFRETTARVARRRAQGCSCVEMEAAALFAVAEFRDVVLGQILYAGDDLSGATWDSRQWNHQWEVREALIRVAAAACLRI